MMKQSVATILLVSGLLLTGFANAEPLLDVFKVVQVKQGDALNMRAWPHNTSRILTTIPYNAKWLASTREPIVKDNSSWRQVHWNGISGWVNAKYTQFDPDATAKARQRQQHRLSQSQGRNTAQKTSPAPAVAKASSVTAGNQVIMECGGNGPFWSIEMDFTGKSLDVDLRNGNKFKTPLVYRTWLRNDNKMIVNGPSKGRNAVKATLTKTNACTDGITNIKYPFNVDASVDGKSYKGCCRSVTR